MATIKSFSDLEQSRKLAEILPLESADMHYVLIDSGKDLYSPGLDKYIGILPHHPAWSLAALLSVLPNENMLVKTTDSEYYCIAKDVTTKHYNNSIDACYELILKLHELKML